MIRSSIGSSARAAALALLLLPFPGCAPAPIPAEKIPDPPPEPTTDHYAPCHNGVVVSVSAPASDVGVTILKQGGNAVDAAVATAFALEVAYPLAGNLGGGGFMLVHPAPGQGDPVVFDYREAAPAAARPDMYTKEDSQYDHKAVAVPGTLRGLAMAHRRFGRLPWKTLLQPAIALARDGFIVDSALAKTANETLADSLQIAEFQRVFAKPDGTPWQAGDRMIQPDLARTLQTLSDLGPDAFYTGPIAREIVAEMQRGHGLITADDLKNYRAIERKPLTTRYRGKYDVYVPPPPSSGGVCLLEELNILENFDLKNWDRWSPKTFHMMAEAMRRANLDRARYLGDPAFVQTPPYLITQPYGQKLAATIDPDKATRSEDLASDIPLTAEGPSTTHFSVIDKNGMAVANTYTLERRWGSRIVVKNMGFLLNNEMRAFNLFPGVTDKKGTVGTPPNLIAPGKRPLSSMTPTIVAQDGRVVLITGATGSRAIPHTILCILVNAFDFGMSPQAAVASSRFSQDWFPDQISFESPERYPETVKALTDMGHTIVPPGPLPFQGDAHTILVPKPGHYVGIADDRISGKAAGY